jgi:mRNA interferase RelE/StbE
MASYKILVRASAHKELTAVPKAQLARIIKKIESLAQNPRPHVAEKISGRNIYWIRQGDYRILYAISDAEAEIRVEKIGHREEVYRHRIQED